MKHSPLLGPRLATAMVLFASLALLCGCIKSDPPRFRANLALFESARPKKPEPAEGEDSGSDEFKSRLAVYEEQIKELDANIQTVVNYMGAMFGTPDAPRVLAESGLDAAKVLLASGPVRIDGTGKQQGLFRRHCVHCHGITGDGMGPTAAFLNPYPRDFRKGLFKFKSTVRNAMPTTVSTFEKQADGSLKEIVPNDLKRTLREGIPGTAMPSFRTLPSSELDALIEYVKYLSLRGQMEERLFLELRDAIDEKERNQKLARSNLLGEIMLGGFVAKWKDAPNQIIDPPEPPEMALEESIERGRDLFYSFKKFSKKGADCFTCHGTEALGDGEKAPDDWNKLFNKHRRYEEFVDKGLILPSRDQPPRNLRQGVFRGGRRPVDIYRRLHAGIPGVAMPGLVSAGAQTFTSDQIWHLVHFVRNL
ncbi:MAG: cytochrome c, partial [Planctomycetes bacterium]|nr:cytochrome c [Planctomycetota bacterium]